MWKDLSASSASGQRSIHGLFTLPSEVSMAYLLLPAVNGSFCLPRELFSIVLLAVPLVDFTYCLVLVLLAVPLVGFTQVTDNLKFHKELRSYLDVMQVVSFKQTAAKPDFLDHLCSSHDSLLLFTISSPHL